MKALDLTNYRSGMLEALNPVYSDRKKGVIWACKCECGNIINLPASEIKRNFTKSCGCMTNKWISMSHKKYNKYVFVNNYAIGYTANNEPFLFDIEDYGKIKNVSWHSDGKGYICGFLNKKQVFLHRVIMGALNDNRLIDHINHCGYDNRKKNLRLCNVTQNNQNRKVKSNTVSGKTGVYYDKLRNKWRAHINANGKYKFIGRYDTLQDAITARIKAEKQYYGEYAPLEFTGEIKEE